MRLTTTKAALSGALIWASTVVGALALCAPEQVDLRGSWGKVRFNIEIADDPQERSLGLMHRESMPRMSGMLFIYETPQPLSFWMRNTLIPLDMLFIDSTGTVVRIHENAIPLDETPISGGPEPLLSVLEINGGMSARLGITPGTQLRHPGLPQDEAAWPCSP